MCVCSELTKVHENSVYGIVEDVCEVKDGKKKVVTKKTEYKLFGNTIFTKEEVCKETNYEGDTLKVYVSPEYYKAEFEDKNNG